MCGIAGFIGEDRKRIERMTEALVHRGPDGNAVYVGKGVSLGHARLGILDPRPEGDQPMWNTSKTVVIVYNGEIYNYRRLREEEGFLCRTGTDTEVLLMLYEKYGIGFVKKLLGMFAFGLYDTTTQTLHLARDAGGIKPLYTTKLEGSIAFASEMRSLMKGLQKKPAINFQSLSSYRTLQYVPGPETMCTGIESLPAGTIVSYANGTEVRTQFQPTLDRVIISGRNQERRALPYLMQDVVTDHMISDRPIGIFLSGGMDSSVVLHHMACGSTQRIKTFTVRFEATTEEGSERFNRDADLASLTAKHYGTDHEEIFITAADFRNAYKATAQSLDQPNADSVSVAQYLMAKQAKKSVDVVLSGAGGDEIFGGYPRYRIARILSLLRWLPPGLRSSAGSRLGYPPDVLSLTPGPELALRLLGRPEAENRSMIRGTWFQPNAAASVMQEHFRRVSALDPTRQMMEVDRSLWLIDESLRLADAVTMASGLECRVPFLDPRLTAWSLATPTSWHVGLRETKVFLKKAYKDILPQHLYTLDKASFYPPLSKWLRRETRSLVEEAMEQPTMKELFIESVITDIAQEHASLKKYGLHQLQGIIQLGAWMRMIYDA